MDDDSNNYNYNGNLSSSCNKHAGAGDVSYRPTSPYNVIESSVFSKLLPSPPPAATTTTATRRSPLFCSTSVFSKRDPGGIGFIDYMGGGVDGLMSCTESLGFESSDERTADDHQMEEMSNQSSRKVRWSKDYHHGRGGGERKEVKKFPPPLSSFNRNGQPSFYLRSVRTDGRLELTEVRIDRPEILRASREDGRLRLHLVREGDEVEEEEEEESLEEEVQDEETLEEEEEDEEEGRVGKWRLEGFRRCNEMLGHHDYHHHQNISPHHHHSHLHVWSQRCVPTR